MEAFDHEAHERKFAEVCNQLDRYETFDRYVDLALDGTVTLEEAIKGFKLDIVNVVTKVPPQGYQVA